MDLTKNSNIESLRAKAEQQRETAMMLMKDPSVSAPEAAGFFRLAMELHDLDRALSDAIFLNNSSAISKLVGEIDEATQAGEQARHRLTQLRQAIKTLREKLRAGTQYLGKAKALAGEVEQLVNLAETGKKTKDK